MIFFIQKQSKECLQLTDSKNRLSNFIKNPSLALWKLSIPMMLGMSVQAIYMLIDTAFIGKWVGSNALAGLGLIFPPMFIIMGITFGLGSGATTVIAQEIGKGKKQLADNAAEHTIILQNSRNITTRFQIYFHIEMLSSLSIKLITHLIA